MGSVANWGGLNNALASWRRGLNALLPKRSTRSDGGRADSIHASTSEHQADSDGTVDAFDEDVNYLGSTDQDGNAWENRIADALDQDFMADPRWHLIIRDRKIRNDEIRNGAARAYSGSSPHTEHTHRQVHQSMEDDGRPWKFTRTKAVLREMQEAEDVTPEQLRTEILNVLKSDEGQAAIGQAAGRGVHNQVIGRSGETIGQDLQSDEIHPVLTQLAEVVSRLAVIEQNTTPATPPTATPASPTA